MEYFTQKVGGIKCRKLSKIYLSLRAVIEIAESLPTSTNSEGGLAFFPRLYQGVSCICNKNKNPQLVWQGHDFLLFVFINQRFQKIMSNVTETHRGRETMAVEELVVHLEESLELTTTEQGVKLVGAVLNDKLVNKWGVRNILRAAWKEMGEVQIKWVKDNLFIIIVSDESSARKILS